GLWTHLFGSRAIHEPFAGAWQKNRELRVRDGLAYPTVFACVNRIAEDVSKLSIDHARRDRNKIYRTIESADLWALLRRPNSYQNSQQFMYSWEASIQSHGNAYVFKEMRAGKVVALHVLPPHETRAMVAPDGSVYYQTRHDPLANPEPSPDNLIPANRIIHDRINPLYHPLVGLSPLYAAALPVLKGMAIEEHGQMFFGHGAAPIGVLVFPGAPDEKTADEVRTRWDQTYSGSGRFRTAVLADGATYEPISHNAHDSQLLEQLQYGEKQIC